MSIAKFMIGRRGALRLIFGRVGFLAITLFFKSTFSTVFGGYEHADFTI
jgi:hypothetical protein